MYFTIAPHLFLVSYIGIPKTNKILIAVLAVYYRASSNIEAGYQSRY